MSILSWFHSRELMVTHRAISVSMLALLLGPLLGHGKDASPGNPPVVLIASKIDADGNLVLVRYKTIFMQPASPKVGGAIYNERSLSKVSLKGVKIYGGDGKEVTVEVARKRLGDKDTAILATSWGRQLPPFYRRVFTDDVLLFAFPQESPTWKAIQDPEAAVRN
jgi:hypothetical protein